MDNLFKFIFICFVGLLSACASKLPPDIRTPPPDNPQFSEVQNDVSRFIQVKIRWGGTIASVENKENETWIEIVARDLEDYGKPIDNDRSPGRFIAIFSGFLEPFVYKSGRTVTVSGTVESALQRKIDDYEYRFPVVRVESHNLWPEILRIPTYDYYPPRHYSPWYPYRYPYFYPYYHRRH